jgi:hypothetical protein
LQLAAVPLHGAVSQFSTSIFCIDCGSGWTRASVQPASEEGAVAQLGERLICTQEAVGSIPISSTSIRIAGL